MHSDSDSEVQVEGGTIPPLDNQSSIVPDHSPWTEEMVELWEKHIVDLMTKRLPGRCA